ncbi:MAG: hypothetical protein ACHQCI_08990 [Solirubrobacterales bacterium]
MALPSISNAAPAPTFQDSVTFTGGPASAGHFSILSLDATSGPSGENPSGQADFFVFTDTGSVFHIQGTVTCLAVSGNTAVIGVQSQAQPFFGVVAVLVVDGQPDIFDSPAIQRAPTDCSPVSFTGFAGPLNRGDITVVDAQPPPTTKDQCKGDGWKQFGFRNQGQCIAFVGHGP